MAPIKCYYHGCTNTSATKSIFRFPIKDQTRLELWIKHSGNAGLASVPTKKLEHRFICEDHFKTEDIIKDYTRPRLVFRALPLMYEPVTSQHDVDDSDDNLLMYCDDKEPTSIPSKISGATGDKANNVTYQGFRCSECKETIRAFRYTCLQCSFIDLCWACETKGAHHQHYVLRIPEPRPLGEVQLVLATIRQQLMKKLDPLIDPELDRDNALSIKSDSEVEYVDEQKPTSGQDSDSSETSSEREQSDNEGTDQSMDEERESLARKQAVSIDTTEDISASHDNDSCPEPLVDSNTGEKSAIHTRKDTRETENECRALEQPAVNTDERYYRNKKINIVQNTVIKQAVIVNKQAAITSAKKTCMRPTPNRQSLVNAPSLHSQSTGNVKPRKRFVILKTIRQPEKQGRLTSESMTGEPVIRTDRPDVRIKKNGRRFVLKPIDYRCRQKPVILNGK